MSLMGVTFGGSIEDKLDGKLDNSAHCCTYWTNHFLRLQLPSICLIRMAMASWIGTKLNKWS